MQLLRNLKGLMLLMGILILSGESAIAESYALPELSLENEDNLLLGTEDSLGQIPSASRLSDVRPTDWAYTALDDLIRRYDCLVGYPDGTFRGNRALTRYEFAAGLNACLDRIQTLIIGGNLANRDDLETLRRLQSEFETELAQLRNRVDTLEARTAVLEDHQFSTTTKFNGNVWINLTGAYPSGDILAERSLRTPGSAFAPPARDANNQPTRVRLKAAEETVSYYTFLTFNTSFTGKDSLITQLTTGNGSSPANQLVSAGFFNTWGSPFLDQSGAIANNQVAIRELSYTFPASDNIRVTVGPRVNYYRYFDGNRFTFYPTGATSFNSNGSTLLNAVDRGSGAVVSWAINPQFKFTVGYLAENTEFLSPPTFNSSVTDGLFKSSNTLSTELHYSPSNNFNLRFIYARSSLKPYNGFIGGAVGEPLPYGYADDGFGGRLNDAGTNTFVVNFDWSFSDRVGLFGRYSYGNLDINPVNPSRSGGEIRVQSFQVGLGFPDLGKQGALGVLSFVVPHHYLGGRQFLLSGGGDGGTQYELEASYHYPLNRNMALVPAFYAIWNANNFNSNPAVYVGNLRAQFNF